MLSVKNKPTKDGQGQKASVYNVDHPQELLGFLLKVLENKGRNAVKAILARGQVMVEGQVTTQFDQQLRVGQTVEVSWVKKAAPGSFTDMGILYEDEDIIVVDKGAGLLSIASDKEKQLTAYRQLMDHLRKWDPKQRVFIVHRLDRDTSGVMLFAKSEEIQQALQNDWKNTVSERTYIALVEGQVKKKTGTITSWLKETRTHLVYSSSKPNGGQKAVTHYAVLKANSHFSLLQVNLETGRKNQIRVHMQEMGFPIVGDKKYGGKGNPIGRLGLHANVLTFKHPRTREVLRFESPIPKRFLNVFNK